jgi:3-oxoacid CoA-transferase subunit B
VKRVVVVMEQVVKGESKLVRQCTLPLTGKRCVHRVITDLGVYDVDEGRGFILRELAPGVDVNEVKKNTKGELRVALPD